MGLLAFSGDNKLMSYPTDLLFYASVDSSLDADYGNDPTNHTETSGIAINTSQFNCGTGSVKLPSQPAPNNTKILTYWNQYTPSQQFTAAYYAYVPTHTARTFADFYFYTYENSNLIVWLQLFQNAGATLTIFQLLDSLGNILVDTTGGTFPLDSWVHVEINYDADAGTAMVFIDGVVDISASYTPTSIGPDAHARYRWLASSQSPPSPSLDIFYDDMQVYDTVQHSSGFSSACASFGPSYTPGLTFGYPFGQKGFSR